MQYWSKNDPGPEATKTNTPEDKPEKQKENTLSTPTNATTGNDKDAPLSSKENKDLDKESSDPTNNTANNIAAEKPVNQGDKASTKDTQQPNETNTGEQGPFKLKYTLTGHTRAVSAVKFRFSILLLMR